MVDDLLNLARIESGMDDLKNVSVNHAAVIQLVQVFTNLVDNAIAHPQKKVAVRALPFGKDTRVTIEDDGPDHWQDRP